MLKKKKRKKDEEEGGGGRRRRRRRRTLEILKHKLVNRTFQSLQGIEQTLLLGCIYWLTVLAPVGPFTHWLAFFLHISN